ncbi:hypothetical protein BH721_00865 [Clostridium baratii]|uniref:Lipoprotein n=1 Tax=Clostridium baratii TaxID=1561 RepID=A0A174QMR6_9CLOT|nr:hypothetical protein [Clostridium baratii]OPF51637.1 hypothetical protein A1M12_03610 [Clostridium baratii]OPF55291.1 hypothetical protein BH721_00865 [Clostridium baratii]OPF57574.1 hypothetical protein BH724_08120 [Clostridium baratii]OPF60328.1 hypothetical protein BH725_07060 [Clostridium baratii]CUP72075.1 lipoprotein [Clostridium baratii]
MKSLKRGFIAFLITILTISLLIFLTYKISFAPEIKVIPIDSKVELNSKALIKKFIPKDIDLSLNGIKFNSNVSLSEEEITGIILNSIDKNVLIDNNVTGINTVINGDELFLYINFEYKGIPLQAVLNFNTYAKNGSAILHYNYGKVGFINISKSYLSNLIEDNSILKVDNDNNNIILSLSKDYGIFIDDTYFKDSSLNIKFHLGINF